MTNFIVNFYNRFFENDNLNLRKSTSEEVLAAKCEMYKCLKLIAPKAYSAQLN